MKKLILLCALLGFTVSNLHAMDNALSDELAQLTLSPDLQQTAAERCKEELVTALRNAVLTQKMDPAAEALEKKYWLEDLFNEKIRQYNTTHKELRAIRETLAAEIRYLHPLVVRAPALQTVQEERRGKKRPTDIPKLNQVYNTDLSNKRRRTGIDGQNP